MTEDRLVSRGKNTDIKKLLLKAMYAYENLLSRKNEKDNLNEVMDFIQRLEDPHTYILIKKQGELNLK